MSHISEMAKEKGHKPGQLALAWILAQGDYIVPIFGTKRRSFLEENIAALQFKLTTEDLKCIVGEGAFTFITGGLITFILRI